MDIHGKLLPQRLQYTGPQLDQNGILAKYPLRLGSAESLAAMDGWVFFSLALVYLHGGFKDAMLVDFMRSIGEDVKFYFHRFGAPVFGGLQSKTGDTNWNFAVMAMEAAHWPAFVGFMTSLTLTRRETKQLFRYGLQELTIADPLARSKHRLLDAAPITLTLGVFGLDGIKSRIAMTQPEVGTYGLPRLKIYPPVAEMQAYAKAYFSGTNPLHAEEITEVLLLARKNELLAKAKTK